MLANSKCIARAASIAPAEVQRMISWMSNKTQNYSGPTVCWLRNMGPETISAAPHGNGLTWKNSGLNTGAHMVPLGSRRADTTPAWVTGKRG